MMRKLESYLRDVFAEWRDAYALRSYAQEGEDMVLRRIFERKAQGFFVDVGAHHPQKYSNTNYFYRRGWRGLNIEPNPDAQRRFRRSRPRDINLQFGVAAQPGTLTYYMFDEPALNSFDHDLVQKRLAEKDYRVVGEIEVPVRRLDAILDEYLPKDVGIDFITVDVEGLDLDVLKSNDWERHRPLCVLAEMLDSDLEAGMDSEVFRFMKSQGYTAFAKTYNTWIFKRPD